MASVETNQRIQKTKYTQGLEHILSSSNGCSQDHDPKNISWLNAVIFDNPSLTFRMAQ